MIIKNKKKLRVQIFNRQPITVTLFVNIEPYLNNMFEYK